MLLSSAIRPTGPRQNDFRGPAFHASTIAEPLVRPAPALGEHTREICRTLLEMNDDEVSKLIADGVLEERRWDRSMTEMKARWPGAPTTMFCTKRLRLSRLSTADRCVGLSRLGF